MFLLPFGSKRPCYKYYPTGEAVKWASCISILYTFSLVYIRLEVLRLECYIPLYICQAAMQAYFS